MPPWVPDGSSTSEKTLLSLPSWEKSVRYTLMRSDALAVPDGRGLHNLATEVARRLQETIAAAYLSRRGSWHPAL